MVQASKSCKALIAHSKKSQDPIDTPIYLQIAIVKNMVARQPRMTSPDSKKPLSIVLPEIVPVPHRTRYKKLKDQRILLVTGEPQSSYRQKLNLDKDSVCKELFTAIQSVNKLTKKGSKVKIKVLRDNYDFVLVESQVQHKLKDIMPDSVYLSSKLFPIGINIKDKHGNIRPERVLIQTKQLVNRTAILCVPPKEGTCFSIQIGYTGMDPEYLEQNVKAALNHLATCTPAVVHGGGWDNITGAHIKTPTSASLPVLNMHSSDHDTNA